MLKERWALRTRVWLPSIGTERWDTDERHGDSKEDERERLFLNSSVCAKTISRYTNPSPALLFFPIKKLFD
jgi:hypothetical protein